MVNNIRLIASTTNDFKIWIGEGYKKELKGCEMNKLSLLVTATKLSILIL